MAISNFAFFNNVGITVCFIFANALIYDCNTATDLLAVVDLYGNNILADKIKL